MTITEILAAYGALLSTAVGTWSFFRDFRDRRKLSVTAMIGKMYPDLAKKDYLILTITNTGRRPVLVKSWSLMRKPTSENQFPYYLVVPRALPRMLKEGECHMEWTDQLQMVDSSITKIRVSDSHGKYWDVPRKDVKKVILEARKMLKSSGQTEKSNAQNSGMTAT